MFGLLIKRKWIILSFSHDFVKKHSISLLQIDQQNTIKSISKNDGTKAGAELGF